MRNRLLLPFVLSLSLVSSAQIKPIIFDGIDKWKSALTNTDMASMKNLYSADPAARFIGSDGKPAPDIAPEIDFWQDLIAPSAMSAFEVTTLGEKDDNGLHVVSLAISMRAITPQGPRTRYVTEQQAWQQQGDVWHIVLATHSAVVKMRPALKLNPHLYDTSADAKVEIKHALIEATKDHQRVILVFGGNWCYDCHVLDQAFHQPDVAPLVEKHFRVVHIDIGDDGKKNSDLAAEYKVPLDKGVPALALLDSDGKLLFSQTNGEWESARTLDPDEVIGFLNKWTAAPQP